MKDRLTYARVLVEMRITRELPDFIPVTMPHGVYKQPVRYEWKSMYCPKCLKLGHLEDECTTVIPQTTEWKETVNNDPKPVEPEKSNVIADKGKTPIIADNRDGQVLEAPPFVEHLSKSQHKKRRQKKKKAGNQPTQEQLADPIQKERDSVLGNPANSEQEEGNKRVSRRCRMQGVVFTNLSIHEY